MLSQLQTAMSARKLLNANIGRRLMVANRKLPSPNLNNSTRRHSKTSRGGAEESVHVIRMWSLHAGPGWHTHQRSVKQEPLFSLAMLLWTGQTLTDTSILKHIPGQTDTRKPVRRIQSITALSNVEPPPKKSVWLTRRLDTPAIRNSCFLLQDVCHICYSGPRLVK